MRYEKLLATLVLSVSCQSAPPEIPTTAAPAEQAQQVEQAFDRSETCDPTVPLQDDCPMGWGSCFRCSDSGKWVLWAEGGDAPATCKEEVEDEQGTETTVFTYDKRGRRIFAETRGQGPSATVHATIDAEATRPDWLPDPNTVVPKSTLTRETRDAAGRLLKVELTMYAGRPISTMTWSYDASGRVAAETNEQNGHIAKFTYDADGRVAVVQHELDGEVETHTYERRLVGDVLETTRTARSGELSQESKWSVDREGRVRSLVIPSYDVDSTLGATYEYDDAGRLIRHVYMETSPTSSDRAAMTFEYWGSTSLVVRIATTMADGTVERVEQTTRDANGAPIRVDVDSDGDGSIDFSFPLEVDARGRQTVGELDGVPTKWRYDDSCLAELERIAPAAAPVEPFADPIRFEPQSAP